MTTAPPFHCSYSPNIPELLRDLKISLALSTYQAGKVVFLSTTDGVKMTQLPRNFGKAMGVAINGNKMAIASKNELTIFKNSPSLARTYPNKPDTYDSLFLPRNTYYTGELSLHDIAWTNKGLVAVNTIFSCLSTLSDEYNFDPIWQPPFISDLHPEDRCHLNGMAVDNGEIKYVTALGDTNTYQGWREKKLNGGIVMEVPSGKVILDGLPMPHSPRVYDNKLYVLLSAIGELIEVDPKTGTYETIVKIGSFARGMAKYGNYLFIGTSKLRHNTSSFKDLPIAKQSKAGICVVYLPYKSIIGQIDYQTSVEEIYDVQVLERIIRPNILNPNQDIHKLALSSPDNNYWAQETEEEE